jgi:aryl-alcohol dehydrogenase-like predicted oxidoreductase
MKMRRLGKTNLQVSEVAFGAWQLGNYDQWGGMTDADALNLVASAVDKGCNLFDTAPNYAQTNSERLLGEALKGRRGDVVIVSKFGHRPLTNETDFSTEWFWESLHQSLERLQTDYIDVFLAHSPGIDVLNGSHEIWEAMQQAQSQGKIRYYGASTDYADQVTEVLNTTDAQVLELLFNMLQQDVRSTFADIHAKDVGVITKVPLDSGWLGGKYNSESTFDGVRARWNEKDIQTRAAAVEKIKNIVGSDQALPMQALAYLLSYEEVTAVIPGIRSMEQLNENFLAAGQSLSLDVRIQIEHLWDELTDHGQHILPW